MISILVRLSATSQRIIASETGILVLSALSVVALHTATNGEYGFHRDELAIIDGARYRGGFSAHRPRNRNSSPANSPATLRFHTASRTVPWGITRTFLCADAHVSRGMCSGRISLVWVELQGGLLLKPSCARELHESRLVVFDDPDRVWNGLVQRRWHLAVLTPKALLWLGRRCGRPNPWDGDYPLICQLFNDFGQLSMPPIKAAVPRMRWVEKMKIGI